MRLGHHETTLPYRLYRPVRTLVRSGFRHQHNVGLGKFLGQIFKTPRDKALDVRNDTQRIALNRLGDSLKAINVQPVTKPQKPVAVTVGFHLGKLVRIGYYGRLYPVVLSQIIGKPLSGAGNPMSQSQHGSVLVLAEVQITEISQNDRPPFTRLYRVGDILFIGLGEDQNIRMGVVDLGP